MTERASRRRLVVLLAVYTALQIVYACTIPPRRGPDELEHLAYVHSLADHGRLPALAELPVAVRDAAGVRQRVASRPTGLPGPHTAQAQHPPLAYLVYALVARLGLSDQALRLVGLLAGGLALFAFWALAETLFAGRPLLRAALPAAVLLPGPVYLSAVVSNDGAAMAAGAFILWRTLRLFAAPPTLRDAVWLGLSLGLGAATKTTLLLWVPFALALLLVQARRAGDGWGPVAGKLAVATALALLPAAPWWAHNARLYGSPIVRAHARPILYNLGQLNLPDAKFFVGSQLGMTLFFWLPTCLLPGWLLNLYGIDVAQGVGAVVWLLFVLGLVALGRWRHVTERPPAERGGVPLALVVIVALTLLYAREFLFQDYEVALFGGRYFLGYLGAVLLPALAGYSVGFGEAGARRLAVAAPLLATLVSLACLPLANH